MLTAWTLPSPDPARIIGGIPGDPKNVSATSKSNLLAKATLRRICSAKLL